MADLACDHAVKRNNITMTGFTLLEMLIVLALLGLLATVLTGAIYLGVTARARVTAVTTDEADFVALQRILNNQLSLAYPDWINAGQYQEVDFTGGARQLQFLAPALMVQGTGFAAYSLSLGQVNGHSALLLRSSFPAGGNASTLTAEFARGLVSVSFSYFGLPRDGTTPLWQDSWSMRSTPPGLIAIKIIFPKDDRRVWPVLIIRPEIDADITCEIDAATHRCLGR